MNKHNTHTHTHTNELELIYVVSLLILFPSLNANARLRNKEGLTPCELAMRLNHDSIVTCFATYVGVGLLDKLSKNHHPSLTL